MHRAFQFKTEAMSLITTEHYTPARAWSQAAGDSEKDSGDEVAPDEEIPPAISSDEQVIFNRDHSRLHQFYHHARKAAFSNAQGKAFIKAFCDMLLTPPHQVLMSTNPNGRLQPGSMSVEWNIGEDWQGESARQVKRQRRALGEERVADVIIWDGSVVTVVFEIKSKTASGGIQQNNEQMAGLLQKGQKVILGVVVQPTAFHLNLFIVNHHKEIVYHYPLKEAG